MWWTCTCTTILTQPYPYGSLKFINSSPSNSLIASPKWTSHNLLSAPITDSKAWLLVQSHSPCSILGLTTESSKILRALRLLLMTLCNWFNLFLSLSMALFTCISHVSLHAKSTSSYSYTPYTGTPIPFCFIRNKHHHCTLTITITLHHVNKPL